MKKKILIGLLITVVMSSVILIGCGLRRPTFEELCVTTEDGFVYYLDDEIGLCIIELPDSEEVTIPEYIDGHRVMQLGYREMQYISYYDHYVDGKNIKHIIIQYNFACAYVNFSKVETITYIDFLYCFESFNSESLRVHDAVGLSNDLFKPRSCVELKKGDREINPEEFNATVIEIPKYVEIIEAGVFDGLEGVTIRTSYASKPEGWKEGWNGNCEVIWGVEFNT